MIGFNLHVELYKGNEKFICFTFPYKETTHRIIGVDHLRGDYRRIIRANKDYSRIIGVSKIILGLLEDY